MQADGEARNFDLNIEKILEGWQVSHAIREIIANALDEQALTGTEDVSIRQDPQGDWRIRDWGRGLTHKHLTENENSEKLENPEKVVGKFGVGLKDALATLDRRGVVVRIRSKYGDFSLKAAPKHGFEDVVTLNVSVFEPADPRFVGTEFVLGRVPSADIEAAKNFFLRYSGEATLEETRYGQILRRKVDRKARVYVTGLLVAEEENFLFSYNVTSLTTAMKRALNRERTNVGRTAYTERVKAMLLASNAEDVAQALAEDLGKMQWGTHHDEVNWTDVAVHAGQVLSASAKVIFAAPHELSPGAEGDVSLAEVESNRDSLDHAAAEGYRVITVPESVKHHLQGVTDLKGEPIRDIGTYRKEWSDSFEFAFVEENRLTPSERQVFGLRGELAKLVGGLPAGVREIKVSETMRPDVAAVNASGLWEPEIGRIVIRRSQLRSLEAFAGTLLHELTHAQTGHTDLSRGFEDGLTEALGRVSAGALSAPKEKPRHWWRR
ncbi:MAG: ATP-binding protein [Gemmataceae bacterium]